MRMTILGLMAVAGLWAQEAAKAPGRGRVLLPGGSPLAGAVVSLQRRAVHTEGLKSARTGAATSLNGDFETEGVEEGDYDVCVTADPLLGVLDPCEWPGEAKRLNVSVANRAAGVVQLATGPRLTIVLEDRGKLLRHPREPIGHLPSALVGAFDAAGFFHVARTVSVNRGVYTYMLAVPKGAAYTLHVSAPGLKFAEGIRAAVGTVSNAVTVGAGEQREEITTRLGVEK